MARAWGRTSEKDTDGVRSLKFGEIGRGNTCPLRRDRDVAPSTRRGGYDWFACASCASCASTEFPILDDGSDRSNSPFSSVTATAPATATATAVVTSPSTSGPSTVMISFLEQRYTRGKITVGSTMLSNTWDATSIVLRPWLPTAAATVAAGMTPMSRVTRRRTKGWDASASMAAGTTARGQ
jgi:hypothetical protein